MHCIFYTLDIVSPDWQLTSAFILNTFINQSTLDIVTTSLPTGEFDYSYLRLCSHQSARLSAFLRT
jgi:hypothetical protein